MLEELKLKVDGKSEEEYENKDDSKHACFYFDSAIHLIEVGLQETHYNDEKRYECYYSQSI